MVLSRTGEVPAVLMMGAVQHVVIGPVVVNAGPADPGLSKPTPQHRPSAVTARGLRSRHSCRRKTLQIDGQSITPPKSENSQRSPNRKFQPPGPEEPLARVGRSNTEHGQEDPTLVGVVRMRRRLAWPGSRCCSPFDRRFAVVRFADIGITKAKPALRCRRRHGLAPASGTRRRVQVLLPAVCDCLPRTSRGQLLPVPGDPVVPPGQP